MYHYLNLFTHIHQADFKRLLAGRNFILLQGELIFEKEGEIFITEIDPNRSDFTIEDYQALPEGTPFELINGKLVYMASPKDPHQNASINLSSYLNLYVKNNRLGKVRTASLDVYFTENNVFQLDILFISNDRLNILKDYVYDAPDFVVEILSPGTKGKDDGEKKEVYGAHGVKEYWQLDPYDKTLEIFLNENGKMVCQKKLAGTGLASSNVVTGFSIEVADIFGE